MNDIIAFMIEFGLVLIVLALVYSMICQVIQHIRDEIKWRNS